MGFSPGEDCLSQAEAAVADFERGGRGRSRSCGRRVPQPEKPIFQILFSSALKINLPSLSF